MTVSQICCQSHRRRLGSINGGGESDAVPLHTTLDAAPLRIEVARARGHCSGCCTSSGPLPETRSEPTWGGGRADGERRHLRPWDELIYSCRNGDILGSRACDDISGMRADAR